ncbi:hypothetical protein B0H13DRAFT_2360497 [Mycena leptocephala]|nr:hypothetical protein B0H13DRAFT_2360497 [Mycena leptocephala]
MTDSDMLDGGRFPIWAADQQAHVQHRVENLATNFISETHNGKEQEQEEEYRRAKIRCDQHHANLINHKPACKPPKGIGQKITSLFQRKPLAALVPSTVSSVPLVGATASGGLGTENNASIASYYPKESSPSTDVTEMASSSSQIENDASSTSSCYLQESSPSTEFNETASSSSELENDASFASCSARASSLDTDFEESYFPEYDPDAPSVPYTREGPYNALDYLRFKLDQIPSGVRGNFALDEFSGNPADFFGPSEPEDRDKLLVELVERVFGSNSWRYDMSDVRQFLYRGPGGLDDFCTFFDYFVRERGFSIKNILDIILLLEESIDREYFLQMNTLPLTWDGNMTAIQTSLTPVLITPDES